MITAIASLRTACTFLICMPPFYIEEQPSINKNLKNIRQVIIAKPAFIKKITLLGLKPYRGQPFPC